MTLKFLFNRKQSVQKFNDLESRIIKDEDSYIDKSPCNGISIANDAKQAMSRLICFSNPRVANKSREKASGVLQ